MMQVMWQYLQRTVPGVGTLMDPIDLSLREEFTPTANRGEEVDDDLIELLGYVLKQVGIGIPYPRKSAERTMRRQWKRVRRLLSRFWGELT